MPPLAVRVVLPLLALAAIALAAGAATAFETQPPHPIGDATFFTFASAANGAGNATVLYTHPSAWGGNLEAAMYSPAGGWAAPTVLQLERNVSAPAVGMDAQGNAIALWGSYNDTDRRIWAATYSVTAGWAPPLRIDNGTASCLYAIDLVVDPAGSALAAWSGCGGAGPFASAYAPGSGWSSPVGASASNASRVTEVQAASDGFGGYLVVWVDDNGTRRLWGAPFGATTLWGQPALIQSSTHPAENVRVAMTSYGDGVAAWEVFNGTHRELWADRYWAGVGWAVPSQIQANLSANARVPRLAVVQTTDIVAAWNEDNASGTFVMARRWTPSGGWGAPLALDYDNVWSGGPRLRSGADGNATAVWISFDTIGGVFLRGARLLPNGKWTSPVNVMTLGYPTPDSLGVVADGSGNSTALFSLPGATNGSIWAIRFHSRAFRIGISTSPGGLQISVDGAVSVAPFSIRCTEDEVIVVAAPTPQLSGGTRFLYLEWLANMSVVGGLLCAMDTNATARFLTEHRFDLSSSPSGAEVLVDGVPRTAPYSAWWEDLTFHTVDASVPPAFGLVLYRFRSWSDAGAINHSVAADALVALEATYAPAEYRVYVTTVPPGLSLNLDGVPTSAPAQLWWVIGTRHTLSVPTPQNRTGESRFAFANWSDGGAVAHTVDATAPLSLVASFAVEWRVSVVTSPEDFVFLLDGAPVAAPTDLWLLEGAPHEFGDVQEEQAGANAAIRYGLDHWSEGVSATVTHAASSAGTLTATFVPRAYRVDLAADAVGVLVLVNGSSAVAPMTLWWPPGGTLSLGAESIQVHARTRYIFSHWSDGGAQNRQMVVSAPVGLKAFFAVEFELTVDTDPPGGNVTVDGLTSEGPRSVWGSPGVAHTVSVRPLVALHPSARLVWVAWSDGGAIVHSVSIAAPTNLSASFEHWFLVTLESERGGVSCDAADCWYASGSSATLRAARYVPGAQGERFRFLGWSASIVNRSLEVTVTVRNPYVARAEWSQEFLLEAKSPYGEVVGAGWYAASSDARVGVNATTVEVEGRVYHFVRWEGDVGSGEPEVVVHMNAPHQLTAVWQQAALQAEPFPAVFLVLPAAALLIGIAFLFWRARRAPR